MAVHVCPRCQRTNPETAAYCYHDGALLASGAAGGNGKAVSGDFSREFVFPSGRRCRNFDEFSQGCQEEWASSCQLLREGIFRQFFSNMGRADLVRATQEAMGQADGDMGLSAFLGVLPVSRTQQPKLDIHPRRLELGKLTIGDVRRVQFTLGNTGQGQLQGTLKIAEGGEWLSLGQEAKSCAISLAPKREQKISLEINTQSLVALQSYLGKLVVITNGGVVEVPVGLDLLARPFGQAPFPNVKTPREMAEHMRADSKSAVSLLESGEVFRWFASNNWNYPVQGQPIKGMAGVQQFFEAMGLSKPPPLQLSQTEFRFRLDSADPIRFQAVLGTQARKWVYAVVESDRPWLRVLTPQVGGPQKAALSFEVDAGTILSARQSEAKVTLRANAGQKLQIRILVESTHPSALKAPAAASGIQAGRPEKAEKRTQITASPQRQPAAATAGTSSPLSALLAMGVLFLIVRIGLTPVVDFWARPTAVRKAAESVNQPITADTGLLKLGGWLRLPWTRLLLGHGKMPSSLFDEADVAATAVNDGNFGAYAETFTIEGGGNGYQSAPPPAVHLTGDGGKGARAHAVVADGKVTAIVLDAPGEGYKKYTVEIEPPSIELSEFRHHFVKFFVRDIILVLWWLGPLLGAWLLWRRGGWQDIHFGLLGGAVAGVIVSATLACLFLLIEAIPHSLWDIALSGRGDPFLLFVWLFLSIICWFGSGLVVGLVLGLFAPLRRMIVEPVQGMLAWMSRRCGMAGLAEFWEPGASPA